MYGLKRFLIAITFILLSYVTLSAVHRHLDPNANRKVAEDVEEALWISTSKHWLDRQACRWIGICGLAHYHPDPAGTRRRVRRKSKESKRNVAPLEYSREDITIEDVARPEDLDGDERIRKDVPQFVLDYAPLVHLFSGEEFWPSDLNEHLKYMTPSENDTVIHLNTSKRTIDNLHELNEVAQGRLLFLKSQDDVEERPDWLSSKWNKPVPYPEDDEVVDTWTDPYAEDPNTSDSWVDPNPLPQQRIADPRLTPSAFSRPQTGPRHSDLRKAKRGSPKPEQKPGYSSAPVHLILLQKPHNITDAFWFYFYSYNLGPSPLNIRFGNHVGDWEHSLIRFQNGVPKAIFCSAHSGGLAYSYDAVEKGGENGRRPVLYSAVGSHAMYATPGRHPYILPFGILADRTDRGPLWDPALNYKAFWYNTSITHDSDAQSVPTFPSTNSTGEIPDTVTLEPMIPKPPDVSLGKDKDASKIPINQLVPAKDNPDAATSWFQYRGHWGDKFYTLADWRQWRFVGYVSRLYSLTR